VHSAIAFEAPRQTFGDALMMCHVAYNNLLKTGKPVVFLIPKGVPEQILGIYSRIKHLTMDYESYQEQISEGAFREVCQANNWQPHFFFTTKEHYKDIKLQLIDKWMDFSGVANCLSGDYVIVHISSSNNVPRPSIEKLERHLQFIKEAGYRPVIVGTKKDEETALKNYPFLQNHFEEESWRFGKDSVIENMVQIRAAKGVVSFSSWSSIFGALAGVPTIEFWNWDQWQHFNTLVKMSLGNPVHLFQLPFDDNIRHNYYRNSFNLARQWLSIYQ